MFIASGGSYQLMRNSLSRLSIVLVCALGVACSSDDQPAAKPIVLPTGALPMEWTAAKLVAGKTEAVVAADVGHAAGAGQFGLRAGGLGIEPASTIDEHAFVYKKISGDMGLSARVVSAEACGPRATFGVMARPTLDSDSAYVLSAAAGDKGLAAQGRVFQGQISVPLRLNFDSPLPVWVRVERRGFNLLAAWSVDGKTWTTKSIASPFPPDFFVGLVVSSHDAKRSCAALFDNVTVSAAFLPLPMVGEQVVAVEAPLPDAGVSDAGPRGMGMMPGRGPFDGSPGTDASEGTDGAVSLAADGGVAAADASVAADAVASVDGGFVIPARMMCNMLPIGGPIPMSRTIAESGPFPGGGPLKDGVYLKTSTETYTGPGGAQMVAASVFGAVFGAARTVLGISKTAEGVYTVEMNVSFGMFGSQVSTSRWTLQSSSYRSASVCPLNMNVMGAAPESIVPYAMNGDDLLTFSVRRLTNGSPAVDVTRYTHQPGIAYGGPGTLPILPPADMMTNP